MYSELYDSLRYIHTLSWWEESTPVIQTVLMTVKQDDHKDERCLQKLSFFSHIHQNTIVFASVHLHSYPAQNSIFQTELAAQNELEMSEIFVPGHIYCPSQVTESVQCYFQSENKKMPIMGPSFAVQHTNAITDER